MLKPYMILLTLLVCTFPLIAQDNQTPAQAPASGSSAIPADAAQKANPVKPTAESLAQGKKYYGYDCAMCHGDNGNGKGEVAISEKMKVGDFSDPATLQGKTDGDLFYIIKNGHGQMPPEGDRVKPTEIWNMVNYVRSLSKKGQ
ncbi:MAG: c-type cytochrome [Candidatus Korobacteraceae bacterium]|jgi:mono/diheme cytochrome c family protein